MMPPDDWAGEVLRFWFEEAGPEQWFKKDEAFDAAVRQRFLALYEALAAQPGETLLKDARTALAAIVVLDQMSRNMFRGSSRAFATDASALSLAEAAVAKAFDTNLTKDERLFCYLPFEHAEDGEAQARCVALMSGLGDPELTRWAEAHKAVIDRFGRFPHRNAVLGRPSTPEEIEFLKGPGSSFLSGEPAHPYSDGGASQVMPVSVSFHPSSRTERCERLREQRYEPGPWRVRLVDEGPG